jgi:alpha-D-ribose 1-methylphosphonate 5-triphosphate synthase subunit PhnH
MALLQAAPPAPGFADPVIDSTHGFRALMTAMANPGTRQQLEPGVPSFAGVEAASVAALLTLADGDTPVWLAPALDARLAPYLRFHCGCPIVASPADAAFGVVAQASDAMQAFGFGAGSDEYPDRSATVLIQVPDLAGGAPAILEGPGIAGERLFAPKLPQAFWAGWRRNAALYPRGIDVMLVCGADVVGLPRSTQVKAQPGG